MAVALVMNLITPGRWERRIWAPVAVAGPSPRHDMAVTYDTGRGMAVIFGGADSAGVPASISARPLPV